MKTITILDKAGSFAENKDVAKEIRIGTLMPTLEKRGDVILDFSGVDAATQSFIHALISDAFRKHGNEVLDRIAFKACNETIQKIITIVSDYMQEGMGIEKEED